MCKDLVIVCCDVRPPVCVYSGIIYFSLRFFINVTETAFFDPSILELLYFPDDQK